MIITILHTSLFIPLFNPVNRTQSRISLEEDLAWSKVLTFGVDTFVVVNVGLVTVLGLVLVWETGVKTNGVQWRVRHCEMISYVELCCVCMLRIGELVATLLTFLVWSQAVLYNFHFYYPVWAVWPFLTRSDWLAAGSQHVRKTKSNDFFSVPHGKC